MTSSPKPSPPTVAEAFAARVAASPDALAVTDRSSVGTGRSVTFADLDDRVRRTVTFLRSLGVQRGDRVATLLPNCLPWIDVHLATATIGALLVPLNTRYRPTEIAHLLRLAGSRVLLTAAEFEGIDFATRLREVASGTHGGPVPVQHVVNVSGDPTLLPTGWTVHAAGDVVASKPADGAVEARPGDGVVVFGTSGTTSAPKLAVHTNTTILSHLPHVAERMELAGTTQLCALSLSGTFGWVPFAAGLLAGAHAVLLPIFKRDRVVATLVDEPCELLVAAEGSLRDLFGLPHGSFEDLAVLQPVRTVVTAGLSIADIERAAAGCGIAAMNVYGSSEVFAFAATSAPTADRDERLLPGGRLVAPGARVRVADENGATVPDGEVGELQFTGDSIFGNYLDNPEASQACRTPDGWFRTGDSARMVGDRCFEYLARANDTLRLGGYSVNPADVETTIESMAGVYRAQVVGVRDEQTGDDLGVAFVQPTAEAGDAVDPQTVEAWCRAELASFKVPKRIVIVSEYPTTPSANGDKVRRDVLRERASEVIAGTGTEVSH